MFDFLNKVEMKKK